MMLRAGPAYQGCPNPWPSPEARGLIPEACHVYTSLRRSDRLRVRGKDCVPLSRRPHNQSFSMISFRPEQADTGHIG